MRKTAVCILIALLVNLLCLFPAALASGSFEAVVKVRSMKVYSESGDHALLGKLSKGTVVTVTDYNDKAARISYNGYTGLVQVSDLKAVKEPASESQAFETASGSDTANATPVVTTKSAKVYKRASKSSDSVKIKSGVQLNLLSVSDGIAKVERGGVIGYMDASCLKTVQGAPEADETAEQEAVVKYDSKPVVTLRSCKVYVKPSTSSDYVTVDAGTAMELVAVKGDCAMVRRNGKTGYVNKDCLTTEVSTAEIHIDSEESQTADNGSGDVFSGSNEQIIYKFLTRVMGYNSAAACGVLSNIKYESDYKPTCGGDGGSSYGIAQWHAERKTRLINWCNSNGYDYKGLKGQLYFLQYELKTYYPAVHSRLKNVSNSAQGAYDAGYDFCYNFEAPSSRASRSVTRANYARDTLWARYKV